MIRPWFRLRLFAKRYDRGVHSRLLEEHEITRLGRFVVSFVPCFGWLSTYTVWRWSRVGRARIFRKGISFGEALQLVNRLDGEDKRQCRFQHDLQLDFGSDRSWARNQKRKVGGSKP
jgi:hypothetical protein